MAEAKNMNPERVTTGKPYAGGVTGLSAGPIFVGPDNFNNDVQLPTSATAALPAGYNCFGYISSDGVSNSIDVSTGTINAWGGDLLLSPLETFSETYQWTCAELNKVVLSTVWGDNFVTGSDDQGLTIDHSSAGFESIHPFVIIRVYEDKSVGLTVIPRGKLTALDAVTYQDSALVGHTMTITALPGGFKEDGKERVTAREYKSAPGAVGKAATISATVSEPIAKAAAK